MIEKKDSVEMVHLVAESTREKVAALERDVLPVEIDPAEHYFFWPPNIRRKTWNAEAPFFFVLLSLSYDNLRIDNREQVPFFFASSCVRNHDSLRDTNLRRGQSDARSLVHRLGHILNELHIGVGDVGDDGGWLVQNLVAPKQNGSNHKFNVNTWLSIAPLPVPFGRGFYRWQRSGTRS